MGNMTGAGIGTAIGALGGPVGMGIGAIIGGTVGMAAEVTNATNIYKVMEGDGGYHIDYISNQIKQLKVRCIYVMKTDLLWTGTNTAASIGRIVFAPMSTLAADKQSFWMQHWFVIFDVIGSGYLVTYKCQNGIFLHKVSTWQQAMNKNGFTRRNEGKVMEYISSYDRRNVQQIVNYVKSSDSYYKINGNNCQDYAKKLYSWF